MKTNNLIFTLLYMAFVLTNVVIVSAAVVMITLKGDEMADTGIMLLFLESIIFLILNKKPKDSLQASE